MNTSTKAVLFLLAVSSTPAVAETYRVVAIAADTGAVVLVAPDGALQRLRRGETVPQSAWRVDALRGEHVTFVRTRPQDGRGLAFEAARGDRVDFSALDARVAAGDAAPPPISGDVIINRAQSR